MRTTLSYVQTRQLNNDAGSTPGGSVDNTTQLRISTGTTSGDFVELTDAQAAALSLNGLIPNIVTAGSGQTNGTYTAAASYGPAILTYVIAGNVVSTVSIAGANGQYTPAFVAANGGSLPTFTLAANGGTAGTVSAISTTLRAGIYQRVKLTSTITSVAVGQALFWNPSDTSDPYAVTNVSASGQTDFAGVVIDANMGATPSGGTQTTYAWIQCTGRATVLISTTAAAGVSVGLPVSSTNVFVGTTATNPTFAGTVLTAAAVAAGLGVVRLTIPQSRY